MASRFIKCFPLTLVGCLSFLAYSFSFGVQALYEDQENVLLLNVTNFKQTVLNTENAWFVQFFNSWCGHCVSFAPTWKALAQEVEDWSKVITIAAVDCSISTNEELCREYEVQNFPTLKFFKPKTKAKDLGIIFRGEKSVDNLRHEMVNFLTTIASDPSLPELSDFIPTNKKDLHSLWQDTLNDSKFLLLIVEDNTSYVGKEVILDFVEYPLVRVLRTFSTNKELLNDINVLETPVAVFLERHKKIHTFLHAEFSKKSIVEYVVQYLGIQDKHSLNQELGQIDEGIGAGDKPEEISKAYQNLPVHIVDLDNAIRYALMQEIPLHKRLSSENLKALSEFLRILVQYYPGQPTTISFLSKLFQWLNETEGEIIMSDYLKFIRSIESKDSHLPEMAPWIGCHSSQSTLRGYPCSLWLLFHTLTVEAYNNRLKGPGVYDPLEVLSTMLGYVKYFFSCKECSTHFQEMASTLTKDVDEADDGVLWLWQAHNKVNSRLQGTLSEDPKYPKIQYPPSELCPSCQQSTAEGPQWDLPEVLSFLLGHFSRQGIINTTIEQVPSADNDMGKAEEALPNPDFPNFQKPVVEPSEKTSQVRGTGSRSYRSIHQEVNMEKMEDPVNSIRHNQRPLFSSWGFNTIDVSLCVLLYVCSAAILLTVYFIVIVKRRLRKKFSFYKGSASV